MGRTDGLGRKTGQSFDAAGRMVRRTNPDRSFETYEYDENDRLARITNARGHARTIKWSDRGEVTELALPDESVERWRYTKTGKVASRANGAGEELGFSYDEADQLTAIVHPGPEGATTFAYDPAGRLTGMTDASGKTEQTYDAAGQVRRLVTPQGTTELTYTDAGEPATRTEVGVGDTTFGYDSAGRLSVVLNPRGEATRFAYDDADRPIRKTFANGVHEETEYDELSRRAADRVENAQGELLRSHRYSYDAASNLRSSTVNGMETSYAYDSRDQLTSESGPGATTSYTYDANGNRLTATADGVTETYTYDPGDKLTRIVAPDGIKTFDYDLAGRTIGVTRGSEKTAFSYDSESRVVKIAYPDGRVSTFSYNGAGARVGRVDSRESVSYRRAGASVLSPVLGDGSANVTPGISENRDGATRFHHGGFKNLDAQTGASGEIVATREYSAFGKVLPSSAGEFAGSSGYGGRFGYRTDRDGGLMLLGHRDYDPSTGRFLTRDPIHVGGNWYAYCGNNPLTRADPSGLRWDWDIIMVVSRWLIANGNANEEIGEQIAKVLAGLGITPTRALVQEVWQTMTALMNRQLAQQAVVEASTFLGLELGASVLAVSAVALLDVALIAGVAYEAYVIFGGPPGRPEMPVGQGPYGLIDKVFDTFNPNSKPIPGMQDGIPRNPRWVPPPRLLAHATDE
ncbi:RHS repeat protein [bacterium]|nr:RHS repeat protein [bacterium]